MPDNQSTKIKNKILELETIYNEFLEKLNELRAERKGIINNIVKRIEEKKIKEILNTLRKKF